MTLLHYDARLSWSLRLSDYLDERRMYAIGLIFIVNVDVVIIK